MNTAIKKEHTPGPWKTELTGDHKRYLVGGVAEVDNDDVDQDEALANARLIAAAPDLLSACRKARTCASIPDAIQDLLRAAIAQAEGRAV